MKTVNIYWLFNTCVLIWFLFVHSPKYVYFLSIVCIINILIITHCMIIPTSMYNNTFQVKTIYLKCIELCGIILGLIEFIFGYYFCFLNPNRNNVSPPLYFVPPLSFSIITNGMMQLLIQYFSYTSIKSYQSIEKEIVQVKKIRNLKLQQIKEQQQQQFQQQNTSVLFVEISSANREIYYLERQKIRYLIQHCNCNVTLFIMIQYIYKIVPQDNSNSIWIVIGAVFCLIIISTCYTCYLRKYINTIQPTITDDVDGIGVVDVDPIQNNNNDNNNNNNSNKTINTSTEVIALTTLSCIDTTATTTTTATNTNDASIPLLQQQQQQEI